MKHIFTCLFLGLALFVSSQVEVIEDLMKDETPKKEYVGYTFKTTRVINGHSIETVKKNQLDFRVSHRFGDVAGSPNDHVHSLFGFDQAADIAIIFEYGITDDLNIGIGRMKGAGPLRELWNANIKYRALKQTKDFKYPMTITFMGNTAISSMRSSPDPAQLNYFPKGYRGFSHRLSYTLQALLACKATDWLSVQLSPTFVWRNNVPFNDKNGMFFLGLSGRAKFNKRMGIVFEYFLPVVKPGVGGREYFPMVRGIKDAAYYPSLHLGFEMETGGHVFHINLSNTRGMLENDFLPYNTANWAQGQFRLGFTISRTFALGRKEKPEDRKYWKKGSVEDQ
jgi:hypothetical protein